MEVEGVSILRRTLLGFVVPKSEYIEECLKTESVAESVID